MLKYINLIEKQGFNGYLKIIGIQRLFSITFCSVLMRTTGLQYIFTVKVFPLPTHIHQFKNLNTLSHILILLNLV